MEQVVLQDILTQVRDALQKNDLITASSVIEALRPADQADVFSGLDDDQQTALLPIIKPANAADIIEEMYDEEAAEIAVQLPLSMLVKIVDEMEPDEGIQKPFITCLSLIGSNGWWVSLICAS